MPTSLDRIHPFKQRQIARVFQDAILKDCCAELWAFGSTVAGTSEKAHSAFSDIDFAILPQGSKSTDIDTPQCRTINERLMDDLTIDGRFTEYDIVWLNRHPSASLLSNIHRGIRIF